MSPEVKLLKDNADKALSLYHSKSITRDEAKKIIMRYIDYYNNKSIEIAKKYKVKPKLLTFSSYIR